MSETATEIPWGELTELWWREAATGIKATEQQMTFAACRFSGMTRTASAKLAGYSSEDDRARKSGSEAAKTTKVQTLISLATLELRARNLPRAPKAPMTRSEAVEKLSDIARGADQGLALRAIEALAKNEREGHSNEIGHFALLDDGLNGWRVCRDFLRMPGGATAIAAIHTGDGAGLSGIPLLHDVVAMLERDNPEFLASLRRRQSKIELFELDRNLADPDWQRDARIKIWREIGVELDDTNRPVLRNFAASAMNGASHEQAAGV